MNSTDYKLIAKGIKQNVQATRASKLEAELRHDTENAKAFQQQYNGMYHLVHNMAIRLSAYRDNFDKDAFLKDCGL